MVVIYKQSPSKLTDRRIDPWHYQPSFEKQINKIAKNLGNLSLESVINSEHGVSSGATPLGANYLEKGRVRFYRTSEVEEMFLVSEEAVYITDEDDEKLKRSRLIEGDILLTITGAKFGKSAVVGADHLPGNISQHSVRFKPSSEKIDSHFLVAYLNCPTGQIAIWREAYGATRPAIDFPSIRALIIPKVELDAQKYIGDKVRQAEQLRAWAKELESEIEQVLNTSEYLVACNTPDAKISHPTLNDLSNRLDPKYYDSKAIAVERFTKKSGTLLGSLIKSIANGFEERNFVNEGVPYITVTEVSSGRLNVQDAPQIGSDISIPSKAIIHERCVLVVRTGSIGTAIKVNILDKGCVISSHLIRLEFEEEETAAAVSVFLNSTAGKILLHKISYGAVQPQIGQEELLALYIPDYVLNKKTTCLTLLENYELTTRASKSLIRTAKTLVEALIEGQLTEEQLIQAQQALEDGDNTLDKTILSKLSSEGYAVEGATPLFSDIDELYRLLASATAADSED
ncbi:restriction endonuclease subunit S [Psychrobacter aquimaris]|uniref:restriction endonuclease subunit S n=1 Tax=Psychrobacter aquimaris TaxID=292733 RepID=UPI0018E02E23|nr:restriction endonuclease subunit S [Psychrobacter aquimaris]